MANKMRLNLALQGGGAHGAFSWGVLDRLLELEGLELDSLSGTSAGAMNAVMLAEGWRLNGALGAKDALNQFWSELALPDILMQQNTSDWWKHITHHLSPYDINPLDINPLRDLLLRLVDFEALRKESPLKLFIAATRVDTAALTLFRETDLSVEHLLASACLPWLHQTLVIEGKPYWDGGFSGNPVLSPLIIESATEDLLCIMLQPLARQHLPISADKINDRMADISFQAAFVREVMEIERVAGYLRKRPWRLGQLERRWRRTRIHLIEPDEQLAALQRSSKLDTRQSFLQGLKERGREHADRWLAMHQADLGRRSTWSARSSYQ
ncbi:patatin-like phospholipase family protein [Nitrincola tapanii]|nr:patatin-like phospholipase family protein [Nitrincola tapanii]